MSHDDSYHRRRSYNDRPKYQGRRFPDRWERYDNVGRDIDGTRFVPFKTPLDSSFFAGKNMPQELQFGVASLMGMAQRAGKQIGLVVDLTNTDRYYRKSEWADYNVGYVKLNCPGHEVNEREDLVEEFIQTCKDFIEDPQNDGKLIGVHCTHGLNRTGYLICRYMIDVDGYTAADAISKFEYYRGHEIERPKYKKSLYDAELYKNGLEPEEEKGEENQGENAESAGDSIPIDEMK